MNTEFILNFKVSTMNQKSLLKNIFYDYEKNAQNFIVNINPEIVVNNYKNKEFVKILNEQKYQIPDGIGIVYASKFQKGNIKERISGIDLMQEICAKSIKPAAKIFLYGSKPGIAEKAKLELEKKYNNINIVRNM